MTGGNRRYKRSDLFLVRIWTPDNGDHGRGEAACHGRVQRVVDGETYQFDSWQALVDALNAMSSPAKGIKTRDNRKKE